VCNWVPNVLVTVSLLVAVSVARYALGQGSILLCLCGGSNCDDVDLCDCCCCTTVLGLHYPYPHDNGFAVLSKIAGGFVNYHFLRETSHKIHLL